MARSRCRFSANGVAGYQAREDFVFRLDHPGNIGSLSTGRFV